MNRSTRGGKNRSERLPLSKLCPDEGIWLTDQRFYYKKASNCSSLCTNPKMGAAVQKSPNPSPIFDSSLSSGLCVEFCSGNGTWIGQKARQSPRCHWVAVEKRLDRAHQIWLRRKRFGLTNLTVACAEASFFCRSHLAQKSVEQCFINFPDPWPKTRHAKHRLLKLSFLIQLSKILTPTGHLFITTDNAQIIAELEANLAQLESFNYHLHSQLPDQAFEQYGTSYFDTLWRSKGKSIFFVHCRLNKVSK